MVQIESVVNPYGILDYFAWKSVVLVHFRLGHTTDPDRLGANLSVPIECFQVGINDAFRFSIESWTEYSQIGN